MTDQDPELQRRWGRLWAELPELQRHAGAAVPGHLEPVLDPKLPDRGYYVDPLSGDTWRLRFGNAYRYLYPFGTVVECYHDGELLGTYDLEADDASATPS